MDPAVVAKLTDAFADAVRAVASGEVRSPEDVLAHVVASAARAVPGADGAGITQVDAEGRIRLRAPSSSWVAELDQRQADLGEGPCVLAARIREDGTASSSVVTLTEGTTRSSRSRTRPW